MLLRIKFSKILIIGSGPSGYTNSLYLIRSNLNPILLTGNILGGQIIYSKSIENWPGIINISGFDLMNFFFIHLKKNNLEFSFEEIFKVNFLFLPFFFISYKIYYFCNFCIISTGSNPKYLNIKNEYKFIGSGISTCAICDGNFYKNKIVLIIGGGNSSIENSFYLSKICKKLILIHRNLFFISEFILLKNFLILKKNIIIKLNTFLFEIICDKFFIKYLKIKNIYLKIYIIFYIDGIFLSIGNFANIFIFKGQLLIFKNHIFIKKKSNFEYSKTNIFCIFSSGDVQDIFYKQAITSSGFGCISSLDCLNLYNKIYF